MAQLPDSSLDEIHRDVMRHWSRTREQVPILKSDLRQLIGIVDTAADLSDTAVIQQIPQNHPGRQWLIENQNLARRLKEVVEAKRREDL